MGFLRAGPAAEEADPGGLGPPASRTLLPVPGRMRHPLYTPPTVLEAVCEFLLCHQPSRHTGVLVFIPIHL